MQQINWTSLSKPFWGALHVLIRKQQLLDVHLLKQTSAILQWCHSRTTRAECQQNRSALTMDHENNSSKLISPSDRVGHSTQRSPHRCESPPPGLLSLAQRRASLVPVCAGTGLVAAAVSMPRLLLRPQTPPAHPVPPTAAVTSAGPQHRT